MLIFFEAKKPSIIEVEKHELITVGIVNTTVFDCQPDLSRFCGRVYERKIALNGEPLIYKHLPFILAQ
jgi:hypothetical protein